MDEKSIEYLSNYITVTEKIKKTIEEHAKRWNIEAKICAWYMDMADFYSDWCNLGYTKTQARKLLHGGKGEFMFLPDEMGIVRFSL